MKINKKTAIFTLAGVIIIAAFLYGITPDEDETFVADLTSAMKQSKKTGPIPLSKLMLGDWSFVCILGETMRPSHAINEHLKKQFDSKVDVSPNDLITMDNSWALVFYFPKSNKAIVKRGNTGIISAYKNLPCINNNESNISVDSEGQLKLTNEGN